jgi:cytochrome b6-f complex iron-sulfur subunit
MAAAENPTPSRRGLFRNLWLAIVAVATLDVAWVVSDFLRPRRRRPSPHASDTLVVAGPVESFERGSVTAFQRGKFYLARLEDGGFLALSRQCTHLGCTVPWVAAEGRFVCPCHASAFDIHGEVLSPPAARPLDLLHIRIENGIVKVETATTKRRTGFSSAQVVRS